MKKRENTSSQYKGVSWKGTKWESSIKINRKTIYLGRFADEEQAAKAYDLKARELFGEFAKLNFPDDSE